MSDVGPGCGQLPPDEPEVSSEKLLRPGAQAIGTGLDWNVKVELPKNPGFDTGCPWMFLLIGWSVISTVPEPLTFL